MEWPGLQIVSRQIRHCWDRLEIDLDRLEIIVREKKLLCWIENYYLVDFWGPIIRWNLRLAIDTIETQQHSYSSIYINYAILYTWFTIQVYSCGISSNWFDFYVYIFYNWSETKWLINYKKHKFCTLCHYVLSHINHTHLCYDCQWKCHLD